VSVREAISQYHPNCQLNIWCRQVVRYSAPGLEAKRQESTSTRKIWHRYEFDFNVLRLSGLHTLAVGLLYGDDRPMGRQDLDEMLPFLFMAPNLKHLIIQGKTDHLETEFPFTTLKKEWHDLRAVAAPKPLSSLESISILINPEFNILPKLANIVDLSQHRSWKSGSIYDPADLAEVAVLFPNLERLFINPRPIRWRNVDTTADNDHCIAAIRAFPPLKYLHISFLRNVSSLERILEPHGPSPRGLIVQPSTQAQLVPGKDNSASMPSWMLLRSVVWRRLVQTWKNSVSRSGDQEAVEQNTRCTWLLVNLSTFIACFWIFISTPGGYQ
jgi:hypothetical protein